MSTGNSHQIVSDLSLKLFVDLDNIKSFVGEPTTNALNNVNAALPTASNSWGTYNTNQYGSGTHFSIGTISSVSGNVVTTAGTHGLRTFDAMQPNATGGGVTAGTTYFIKKISDTQFTLHEYNGSQNGSQGYYNTATGMFKVHDSIANDTRISINSSGFPNMWWGPPHVPNSGLVKEFIADGFNAIPNVKTGCLRQHVHRSAGSDHMAYEHNASITPNLPVTYSCWMRAVSSSAVGKSINWYHYRYGTVSPTDSSMSCTLGQVGVWTRYSYTNTPPNDTVISYWFNSDGPYVYDIAQIQIESNKSHATTFTSTSRSNTEGLKDLSGNNTLSLASAAYDASGNFTFNGSAYITGSSAALPSTTQSAFTYLAWVKPSSVSGWQTIIGTHGTYRQIGLYNSSFYFGGNAGGGNSYVSSGSSVSINTWVMLAMTYDGIYAHGYKNGVLALGNQNIGSYSGGSNGVPVIGAFSSSGGEAFNGTIAIAAVYNRCLTAAEILQNFNAHRVRFGL